MRAVEYGVSDASLSILGAGKFEERALPVAPDAAIEALVRRQESELERIRALATA
ncbi:hypothetical protein GCM10009630_25810 [Kribbella jejuensis]|uniref:Uncharacterized protein n=1 Tax=Kribbella jejuensis TaxID=236068 RepID=A0A542DUS3_9ACTN|nr:hypothetical protein [Kribbella jejuensis]TQJ06861.1 hypothetical protein FB475_6537 [Kribbella jejuensis]